MIRSVLARIRARIAAFWDLEDPDERIEGTGEPYLDPVYNPNYTAERRFKEFANDDRPDPEDDPDRERRT